MLLLLLFLVYSSIAIATPASDAFILFSLLCTTVRIRQTRFPAVSTRRWQTSFLVSSCLLASSSFSDLLSKLILYRSRHFCQAFHLFRFVKPASVECSITVFKCHFSSSYFEYKPQITFLLAPIGCTTAIRATVNLKL